MEKWSQSRYAAHLQELKQEAHDNQWLFIDINARELMEKCEPGCKNLNSCCKAMTDAMLEGDGFVVEPRVRTKVAGKLTIRYYVDNLHPSRRKYAEILA